MAANPKRLAVDLILMGNRRPWPMFACFRLGRMWLALTIGLLARELDRLHGVGTSLFPSIGTMKSALTVMADALRLGEHLLNPRGIGRLGAA